MFCGINFQTFWYLFELAIEIKSEAKRPGKLPVYVKNERVQGHVIYKSLNLTFEIEIDWSKKFDQNPNMQSKQLLLQNVSEDYMPHVPTHRHIKFRCLMFWLLECNII